jgi:Sulfotransferase family
MKISYTASRVLDAYPSLDAIQVERWLTYGSSASLQHRFVYLEVPKAASSAMKAVLRELREYKPLKLFAGPHREVRRNMFIHSRANIPFPPVNALSPQDQKELLEASDVLRFTIVRNPYTRLVSAWRDKVFLCDPGVDDVYAGVRHAAPALKQKNPIAFAEFISYLETRIEHSWDVHWRRQIDLTFPQGIAFTHIGKVEDLPSTISVLTRHLGREKPITFSRSNEGTIKPIAGYSHALAARVFTLYEADFLAFEYKQDSWPRDEQTGPRLISEELFVDEVIERNLIIAHLYDERDRLMKEYNDAYRWSLARVKDKLRRALRVRPQ